MEESISSGMVTISVITLISIIINVVTIYRWVSDYLRRESANDQAFHMMVGLANSVMKRVGMIVRRVRLMESQDRASDESMIFLENMWADSMATADNLLAAAKALKPKSANTLPRNAEEILKNTQAMLNESSEAAAT